MDKYALRRILSLVIIIFALTLGVGFFKFMRMSKPEPTSRPPRPNGVLVEVMKAQPQEARVVVSGFGSAEARTQLALVAQVSGRVTYLNPELRAGGEVEEGAVLVRIDPRKYQVAIERAEAAIAQAKSNLESIEQERVNLEKNLELARREAELARRSLERARNLLETGAGSEGARDSAEQALVASESKAQNIENALALIPERVASARATLAQNTAQLHDAELNLEYSEIKAPFAGRVTNRRVEPGQFVGIGAPLADIYAPEVLEIPIRISLEDLVWISADGLRDGDRGPEARVILRLNDANQCVWNGYLTRIDRSLDEQSRTAGAIVRVDDPKATESTMPEGADFEQLSPGTFVEVEINGRLLESVYVLPRKVLTVDNKVNLYVKVDTPPPSKSSEMEASEKDGGGPGGPPMPPPEGKLVMREVEVARSNRGMAYVTKGLEPGDQVVTTILAAPIEGMALRLNGKGPDGKTSGQGPKPNNPETER